MNRDISHSDFIGLEFQSTRHMEFDHQDKPNTRALWATLVVYLVLMVGVISAVKFFVTGAVW